METEAIREFLSAQIHALAKRDDPVRRWIVDDPARKLDFASHMSQDLARSETDRLPATRAWKCICLTGDGDLPSRGWTARNSRS